MNKLKPPVKFLFLTILAAILWPQTSFGAFGLIKDDTALNYNFTLEPGKSGSDSFIVSNYGNSPLDLIMYGADAVPSGDSAFAAKSFTDKQTTIGTWIKFEEKELHLDGLSKETVQFAVNVPDKTPPGTYAGAVAVSTFTDPKKQGKGMGVISIQRSIIPVYVKIPGEEKTAYEFITFSFEKNNINPFFQLDLKNEGNTVINADGQIDVFNDALSLSPVATLPISKTEFYGGDESNLKVPLGNIATNGLTNNFKAVAKITFYSVDIKSGQKTKLETVTKELAFGINHWDILIWSGLGVLALIMLIVARILMKRNAKKNATPYVVKENDTIENIAKNNNVNWKKITKMNKLKPPYSVKAGDTILIPKSK